LPLPAHQTNRKLLTNNVPTLSALRALRAQPDPQARKAQQVLQANQAATSRKALLVRPDPQAPAARRAMPDRQAPQVALSLALAETQVRSVPQGLKVRLVLLGLEVRASRVLRVPLVLRAPPASKAFSAPQVRKARTLLARPEGPA
jgi:hypothetical protein